MHVLVVDDKPIVRKQISALLLGLGFTVDTAANGLDGYEKSLKGCYDLYIVDHLMPIMNGVQMVKGLKSRPSSADTPILFMTTQEFSIVEKLEEFSLFDAIINKPITTETFHLLIKQLLPENSLRQSL